MYTRLSFRVFLYTFYACIKIIKTFNRMVNISRLATKSSKKIGVYIDTGIFSKKYRRI